MLKRIHQEIYLQRLRRFFLMADIEPFVTVLGFFLLFLAALHFSFLLF